MKFLAKLSALVGGVTVLADRQCERHVELMLLQDGTTSYYGLGEDMARNMNKLIARVTERLGSAAASVSIFSDKPVPFRGNGNGRGYVGQLDVCYYNQATFPLGTDPEELKKGYDAIYSLECEGGDYPENPYEAMLYAAQDPKVQWSPADKVYTDDDRRIVKVLVTVTDDHPHYAGDAKAGIHAWNPIPEGSPADGYPHFFDESFPLLGAIYADYDDLNTAKYTQLLKLHAQSSLTQEETVEYNSLLELLGPAIFDAPIAHPGTFDVFSDCARYEYPTLKQVGEVLNRENVMPIMLLSSQSNNPTGRKLCKQRGFPNVTTDAEWLDCLLSVYKKDFQDAGFNHFMVEPYGTDADELIDQIVNLVDRMSLDITCPDDTTTTEETSALTTTSAETKTADETTSASETTTAEGGSSGASDSTAGDETTGNDNDSTKETSATGTTHEGESTTTDGDRTGTATETGTETTGIPPIVPIIPVAPGSNTAVVAGAAGGSVAGAAAIGGLLYKKFGASLLGGNNTPDLSAVEQVEVPETPVEREAFEEVTMDMFQ